MKYLDGASWDLELAAITEIVRRRELPNSPVLLFDNIEGPPAGYHVLANCDNSMSLVALSLGVSPELSGLGLVRTWKEKMKEFVPIPPGTVDSGPVLQNVHTGKDVGMLKFPIPKWYELDGGRYIGTDSVVVPQDPDEEWINTR